jgi:cation diffusion facilitator CzcD-associated flavoprotein CzcO
MGHAAPQVPVLRSIALTCDKRSRLSPVSSSDAMRDLSLPARVNVLVIGVGQAGLSAGFHLKRRGFLQVSSGTGIPVTDAADLASHRTFTLLDANPRPGGAWQHRWRSLTMATINGIYGLPGMPTPPFQLGEPAVDAVPRYFESYESFIGLEPIRPVLVNSVERVDDDPRGSLLVRTTAGDLTTDAIINATGTWTHPFIPYYPGGADFAGEQLHVADYVSATEFAGKRVAVVGGGISAVQLLEELSHVTTTLWFTRREPVWHDESEEFDGTRAVAQVEERVERGLPPESVVSATGLFWTPSLRAAAERGVLDRHPMFMRIEPLGVRSGDGGFEPVGVILWATGFRAALDHLAPLGLRGPGGGIAVDGTMVRGEPRVHLIGYGPSSSTVGANRAGRAAVNDLVRMFG